MRALLALFALVLVACATYALGREDPGDLLVTNRAWGQVTVYSEPVGRVVGRCGSQETCRLHLRPSDVHRGLLRLSYRELTWPRDQQRWMEEVGAEIEWELIVGRLPQFSYMRPASDP